MEAGAPWARPRRRCSSHRAKCRGGWRTRSAARARRCAVCALVAETSGLLSSAALRQVDCVICNSSWALEGGFAVILVGARAARGDKTVRKERRREGGGRTGAPSGPLHLSPSGSLLMCIRPLARVTLIRRLNQKFQLLETLHSYAFSAHHSFMFTSLGEPYTPCARCGSAALQPEPAWRLRIPI